jgi:hypothetical protein
MSIGQVERGRGWVKVGTDVRAGGRRAPAERALCIARLRQWLEDSPDARTFLASGRDWHLLGSIQALRRRVERFNQEVPAGLAVELSPELLGLLAEARSCES